jgi:hypothetical protein
MAHLKEPEGVILTVEKRKLSIKERKMISDFIENSKMRNRKKIKTTVKSKNKSFIVG